MMRCPNHRPPFEDGQELSAAEVNDLAAAPGNALAAAFQLHRVRGLVRLDQPPRGPCNRFEVQPGELLVWGLAFVSADGELWRGDLDRVAAGPADVVYLPAAGPGEQRLIALPAGEAAPSGAQRLGTVTSGGFRIEAAAWTLDAADELAAAWGRLRSALDANRQTASADDQRQLRRVLALSGETRVADAVRELVELRAEVPFPSGTASVAEVLTLFESLTAAYRKDEPMEQTLPPAAAPAPASPAQRRWRLRAAVAVAALTALGVACLFASWPGGAAAPPDVQGSAALALDRLPIPGMLAEQQLSVALEQPDQPHARLLWELYRAGQREPSHAGELPIDTTAATLAAAVLPKFGDALGHGVLRIAVGPSARPKWSAVRLGAPLPNGLTYVSSQRDPSGAWYTTARRQADGALVSVMVSPDGAALSCIDQQFVSVRAYLDRFMASPTSATHRLAAAGRCSAFPLEIRGPRGHTISVADAAQLAEQLGRPFLDSPAPWRGYPSAPYLQERFGVPLTLADGQTTDDMPVIGLSSYDALAYVLWVNQQTGQRWTLAARPHFGLGAASRLEGPAAVRHEAGRAARGLYWATGNLWHLEAPADGTARTWGSDWRGVEATGSIPAETRPTNAGFRLALVHPITYPEAP